MKKWSIIVASLLLCFALLLPIQANADFGDFSGNSDFGGGFDFDTGSDWGSSDWSSSDWDDSSWDDAAYAAGGYALGSNDDDDEGGGFFGTLVTIVIIGIVLLSIFGRKKPGNAARQPVPAGAKRTDPALLTPMLGYKALDPTFNHAAFIEKLSNLYVQMQNGWQNKDIESLRPYFTDALFTQMERQIEGMKKAGRTNFVERIAVLGVELKGYMQANGEDHIIAELRTRIVDYTVDAQGKLVSGDMNKEKFMTYEWDLSRATGMKTKEAGAMEVVNCPNCGAPLSINTTAKCPYCDSVVTLDAHDWAICSIKGISQVTR